MDAPIFVGGAGRSGKTLVRWMLSSHTRIVVTRRTDLWPRFFERFGDLADEPNLERCVAAMFARPQVAALQVDADRLRQAFRAGPRSYGRLFGLLHEQVAERDGKPRWGDQSAGVEAFADDVIGAFPDAMFVHLIRDPRDRFVAELERDAKRRAGDVGRSVAAWRWSAGLAQRNHERYPDAYLVVRYEALVTDPERTTRELCRFLGERFDRAMLRMDGADRYREARDASPDGIALSTGFIGRFRDGLPSADVAFIQHAAAREMGRHGYLPDAVAITGGQRLRFAATRSVNEVAMLAWTRTRPRRLAPRSAPSQAEVVQ